MGMYDEVILPCPNNCPGYVRTQSKAGECTLDTYSLENVPLVIARDVADYKYNCPKCGEEFVVSRCLQSRVMAGATGGHADLGLYTFSSRFGSTKRYGVHANSTLLGDPENTE